MNNILDANDKTNHLFLSSVIAVLCENFPITIRLEDIEKFWNGEIVRLQYDMIYDVDKKQGSITFSLKEKE